MCRFCWFLSIVLAIATAGLAWKFILSGETVAASDGRTGIVLEAGERNLVLAEMRAFLEATQKILDASVRGDVTAVSEAARAVGRIAAAPVPGSLLGKLPLGFKRLGFATHDGFDRLAMDVEALGDTAEVPERLAQLMNNCVGCHATFRLEVRAQ